jgi:CRP/FNR family cyclic AMP-dependent transcriptional regulator
VADKERLKQFPVFSAVPDGVLTHLAKTVAEEVYAQGAVIFAEGKWGDALYFVLSGEVIIRKVTDGNSSQVVAILGPGEFFGEMALLENAPRSATALAHTEAVLLTMPKAEFDELLKKDPNVAREFFRGLVVTLSQRLRQTTRELVSVYDLGRALALGLNAKALANRVTALGVSSIMKEGTFGAFFMWNEYIAQYELTSFQGPLPVGWNQDRTRQDPFFNWLTVKRVCLESEDWAKDERFSSELKTPWPGAKSLLVAPIFVQDQLTGVVMLGHAEQAGLFGTAQRKFLEALALLVSPAFENAAWREELEAKKRLERSKGMSY